MPIPTNFTDQVSDPSSLGSGKADNKEAEKIIEPTFDPPALFTNKLWPKKNTAQMEKILDIFKQVKMNVSLLEAIE